MKSEIDNCWYQGRHEFCKETYPGQYEWCSPEYHRCVECTDDAHCPPGRPWCDWDMECEECLVSAHCSAGESCLMRNGRWVCRHKDCVDYRDEGVPDYCRNNFRDTPICDIEKRKCVECIAPSDCSGERETCINSVCVDESVMDCMQQIEAGFTNYCEVTFPERPVCHTRLRDCVECQFDNHCENVDEWGKKTHTCAGTRCVPIVWECEGPEDCLSDRYKCVRHECIKRDCSDYDDPDEFCESERSLGWRCLNKICVRCIDDEDCDSEYKKCVHNKCVDISKKDECTEPDYPAQFCIRTYGEDWVCKEGFCVKEEEKEPAVAGDCREYLSSAAADEYCGSVNPAKPHCDFDTGKCWECVATEFGHCPPLWRCWNHECRECIEDENCLFGYRCTGEPDWSCVRRVCTDEPDPDAWCVRVNGLGYSCIDDVCTLTDCDGQDERCPKGFYCPEKECVWGCRDERNCPEAKPHCSAEGNCVECFGAPHCDMGYKCIDYVCVKQEDCLRLDSLCPKNEYCNVDHCEEGCRDNRNCAETTPNCSQKTGRCEECVFDNHCEEGYDCDDFKCVWVGYDCVGDPDCPENWFCHDRHFCVFGCHLSSENCGKGTPNCSQETGKCEECWSNEHCEWWQECEEFRCVARKDNAECKPGDKKHGKRCRNGIWVDIECKGHEDCLGHEYCDDGLCRDRQHECELNSDCIRGYYCGESHGRRKCLEQACRSHADCPIGQGCDYAEFGWKIRDNVKTHCFSGVSLVVVKRIHVLKAGCAIEGVVNV